MIDENDITIEETNDEGGISPETVKKLREKLKKCTEEKSEYLAGWQRAKADFINARRDEEERRADFLKFCEKNLLSELLVLADSFDAFFNTEPTYDVGTSPDIASRFQSWRKGIENLRSLLMNILKNRGVEPLKSIGEVFNPLEHEAVGEEGVDKEEENNIIVNELRKGYKIHNKILRPAQVKVGKFISK